MKPKAPGLLARNSLILHDGVVVPTLSFPLPMDIPKGAVMAVWAGTESRWRYAKKNEHGIWDRLTTDQAPAQLKAAVLLMGTPT